MNDALVRSVVKGFFEVEHDTACVLFFVETFRDVLVESGYVVLAAHVFPET